MQPCSQPRYGFTLVSNPTSGLLLRVMMLREPSRKYCVTGRDRSSWVRSTSTTSTSVRSTWSFSKRLAGLQDAPRPRMVNGGGGVSLTIGTNFVFAVRISFPTILRSHEHNRWSSLFFGLDL